MVPYENSPPYENDVTYVIHIMYVILTISLISRTKPHDGLERLT